jgi:triacylglycerol lipase
MGGLDARYALAHFDLPRVRALVTIATPHRGTPFASFFAPIFGKALLRWFVPALVDLAEARVAALLPDAVTPAGVWCGSVTVAPPPGSRVQWGLRLPHAAMQRLGGPNDGVVSVASQRFGEVIAHFPTDHWGAVGWGRHFDAPRAYVGVVAAIVERAGLEK